VRNVNGKWLERKHQKQAKQSEAFAKSISARRQKNLEMLKSHTAQNGNNLKLAEQCLVAGNLADAENLWKQVRPMRSPPNTHLAAYLRHKEKILERMPSKITEMRESVEEEDCDSKITPSDRCSFILPTLAENLELVLLNEVPFDEYESADWEEMGTDQDPRRTLVCGVCTNMKMKTDFERRTAL
jgi:hypothetical protein